MNKDLIRNFSIIAHIDHGKSTLADRFLLHTGAIDMRTFHDQLLDDMDLERERGITIKASAVRIFYKAKDQRQYLLNLIDTPGHVDFSYEVKKSLAACEGALLVVDASQGVEAQTVANLYLALEHNLKIIPVINKIDIANIDIERVKKQIEDILQIPREEILLASAKEGIGIDEILQAVVDRIPTPSGNKDNPLQALVFDSKFDTYKGVIVYVRVVNGFLTRGMKIKMMATEKVFEVQEIGIFKPKMEVIDQIECGQVGYLTCNLRDAKEVINGDTVTTVDNPARFALPGYKKIRPMVYCGIYPVNSKDFDALKDAMEKLSLNDASFTYEPESSASLGFGFRCGFLGLLHMDIVQERLEREYDLNLVITTPSVVYKIVTRNGEVLEIDNPTRMPAVQEIDRIEEPFISCFLFVPAESIGAVMDLAMSKRGVYKSTEYLTEDRAKLIYDFPLSEVLVDFYDKIKSITRGYGSLDYEFVGYQPDKLVKLDILLNGEPCDALSSIVHKEKAQDKGRQLVDKLRQLIPKQLIEVVIQAAIGGTIIARASISPLRKHVTGKCYGGDITRKRKLWEKQKEGKKRMKQFGRVQVPQEALLAALKLG
jgi:GTP-binding protein LepA